MRATIARDVVRLDRVRAQPRVRERGADALGRGLERRRVGDLDGRAESRRRGAQDRREPGEGIDLLAHGRGATVR